MESKVPRYQEILNFWFGSPKNPKTYGKEKNFWFSSTTEDDNRIRNEFYEDYKSATKGKYEDWKNSAYSSLALILLLDQVPRNIFRNTPQTYETDGLALENSKLAVGRGYLDQLVLKWEKKFMIMPHAHSENLEDQKKSVQLFRLLGNQGWTDYAIGYYETIKKYGRFPHRDRILDRSQNWGAVEESISNYYNPTTI